MRGTIREDDGGLAAAIRAGEPYFTDPDPYGLINRFCNHFLDPITRSPLNTAFADPTQVLCPNAGNQNATNWAMSANIGGADAFSASPVAVDNFRNHFTIPSAREAMWRALTLKNKDGAAAQRLGGDTDEQTRKAYWASTFRALGNVLHLNQDMAQPQHTRNEGHGPGHSGLFERYVDARAAQTPDTIFKFDGEGNVFIEQGGLPVLPLNSAYPIPRFNRYSDFWSTDQSSASILAGKGLADYSSRGFFTPAKNLGTTYSGFPNPVNNENVYTITTDSITSSGDCTGYAGRAQYARANLPDDFIVSNDPTTKVKYASRSLVGGQWTLNRCVFEERVDLLIPRAVAYSAGLIDYFFRGQMEITPPDEGVYSIIDHYDFSGEGKTPTNAAAGMQGFKTIKLKLRNATPDIVVSGGGGTFPQIMPGGTLVAVLKFYRNLAYTDDLAGEPADASAYNLTRSASEEIVVSSSVKDGSGTVLTAPIAIGTTAQIYEFGFTQALPINATDVQLQVVYRGPLGSEADAVVVQTVDISEPTYMTYMNATDYIRIDTSDIPAIPTSVYTLAEINAITPLGSTLRSRISPATCIDTTADQLKDIPGCHQPFAINFPVKLGTSTIDSAGIALPNAKTYHRLAMLVPPGGMASVNQSLSPCLPNDPITFPGKRTQRNYIADASPIGYHEVTNVDNAPPVRGVRSWAAIACVNNGDNSVPGAGDNRYVKMLPLTGINLKPLATQGFKFGTP